MLLSLGQLEEEDASPCSWWEEPVYGQTPQIPVIQIQQVPTPIWFAPLHRRKPSLVAPEPAPPPPAVEGLGLMPYRPVGDQSYVIGCKPSAAITTGIGIALLAAAIFWRKSK